jgi:hypothetical protein
MAQDAAPPRFAPIREKLPRLAVVVDKKIEPAGIDDVLPSSIPIQEELAVAPSPTPKPKQGDSAAPATEKKKIAVPPQPKKFDRRCAFLDERIQLGDSISEQERSFYAENCH